MTIAYKTLVERDVGRTKYGTTLTTTVGVTLDGWNTIDETGTVNLTNDDMCLTKNVTRRGFTDGSSMIAYRTGPTAAIDVTTSTTFDIGVGTGSKTVYIGATSGTNTKDIVHTTGSTCSVNIFLDFTAKQGDVSFAIDITTQSC